MSYNYYRKEIEEEIKELHDVSGIVEELERMDPDDPSEVEKMIAGIIFQQEEEDAEGYDGIRLMSLKAQGYISDYIDLLRVLRGDFAELVFCERKHERVHGSKDPDAVLKLMRLLVEGDMEAPCPMNYEAYTEYGVCMETYMEQRFHDAKIEYDDYTYSFTIDRLNKKVYVKA